MIVPPAGRSPCGAAWKTGISRRRVRSARGKRGASLPRPTSASCPRSGVKRMSVTKKAATNRKFPPATAAVPAAAADRPRRRGRSPHGRWTWAKLGNSKPHESQNDLGCWGIDDVAAEYRCISMPPVFRRGGHQPRYRLLTEARVFNYSAPVGVILNTLSPNFSTSDHSSVWSINTPISVN